MVNGKKGNHPRRSLLQVLGFRFRNSSLGSKSYLALSRGVISNLGGTVLIWRASLSWI
jgi:hypothetical protein